MTEICCIGHITRDRIITQDPPNTVYSAGGSAYYVAWAFQALPHDVDFQLVTSVSREMMSEVERLREAGVSVKSFESPDNVFFENKYGKNMDNRTQRVLAKSAPFTIEQLEGIEARVFHLATKGDVSIDVQGYMRYVKGEQVYSTEWNDKLRLLKHTAILKVNEWECQTLTGITDPFVAAEQIHAWGVREVIVTLGGGGSIIYAEGKFYETPAYPPSKLVDATGCGDTYSAGYLYARDKGMSYEESGRFAAAMCTLKLEHTGPFDRTIDDVHDVLSR